MRYEVAPAVDGQFVWHRRAGNGQITSNAETYTRHEDAVRAVRTDVEDTVAMLGISEQSFHQLYAPDLTYFAIVHVRADGTASYEERPLYPAPFDESTQPNPATPQGETP